MASWISLAVRTCLPISISLLPWYSGVLVVVLDQLGQLVAQEDRVVEAQVSHGLDSQSVRVVQVLGACDVDPDVRPAGRAGLVDADLSAVVTWDRLVVLEATTA